MRADGRRRGRPPKPLEPTAEDGSGLRSRDPPPEPRSGAAGRRSEDGSMTAGGRRRIGTRRRNRLGERAGRDVGQIAAPGGMSPSGVSTTRSCCP